MKTARSDLKTQSLNDARNSLFWPALAIMYFASRVIFFPLGYGVDSDAWRVAKTGIDFIGKGIYSPSRPPGYPAMEILVGLLKSSFASNLAIAILGFAAIIAFHFLCKQLALPRPRLTTIVFAFTPLFLVFSATTMDYIPSLTFVLWALVTAGMGLFPISGFLFGMSLAFRPAGVILLPCWLYYLWLNKMSKKDALFSILAMASVVAICFITLLVGSSNGASSVPFSLDLALLQRFVFILYRSYGAFDLLGWIAILIGLYHVFLKAKTHDIAEILFVLSALPFIALWIVLPHESAYWLTLLPFILLAIFTVKFKKKIMLFLGLMLILPAFISITPRLKTPTGYILRPNITRGIVIEDIVVRRRIMRYRSLLSKTAFPDNSLVICGRSSAYFELNTDFEFIGELKGHDMWRSKTSEVYFVDGVSKMTVDSWLSEGKKVFILEEAVPATKMTFGWLPEELGVEVVKLGDGY
ncbi:hypothetical protein KAH81_01445 [bacterium]|nr:hypothetical protein [bacterium]